mmetsp:Transcript_10425/g.15682  ORF Transcript_10425/g.15682 Transcript_10425/m.15682 type:complete len:110 (+) Transcript_10425:33-362(+)
MTSQPLITQEQKDQQQAAASNDLSNVNNENDTDDEETPPPPDFVKDSTLCWICQSKGILKAGGKSKITHASMPCNCPVYCMGCAMKMATGGKCKRCKQMFVEFRKVSIK